MGAPTGLPSWQSNGDVAVWLRTKSSTMFEHTERKLKVLETAIFAESEKYVDKFEALSIASVEVEEPSASTFPEMRKLKVLATELSYILNEAYIEQQSLLGNTKTELSSCNSEWNAMSTNKAQSSNDHTVQSTESQLKHQLKHIYDQIAFIVDFKSNALQTVQRVCDRYTRSMVSMGQFSGVLHASKKVALVTAPHFQPLVSNRFFATQEVPFWFRPTKSCGTYSHPHVALCIAGGGPARIGAQHLGRRYS
jgi:hypothetical protein